MGGYQMLDHMYFFDVSRLTDLFIRNFFYKQQKHSPGCQLETSVVTPKHTPGCSESHGHLVC